MKLVESLNTVLPYQCIMNTDKQKQYMFQFDNIDFVVCFIYNDVNDLVLCAIDFFSITKDGHLNVDLTSNHKNSLRMFSTVCHIIQQTINSWDVLTFINDPSRSDLYGMLIKKLGKHFKVIHQTSDSIDTWFVSKNDIASDKMPDLQHRAHRMRTKK